MDTHQHRLTALWFADIVGYSELADRDEGQACEIDEAFEIIDQMYEERDIDLVYVKVNPLWEPLRSDPRYAELLEKMGLD
jgi:hypothetical protein